MFSFAFFLQPCISWLLAGVWKFCETHLLFISSDFVLHQLTKLDSKEPGCPWALHRGKTEHTKKKTLMSFCSKRLHSSWPFQVSPKCRHACLTSFWFTITPFIWGGIAERSWTWLITTNKWMFLTIRLRWPIMSERNPSMIGFRTGLPGV